MYLCILDVGKSAVSNWQGYNWCQMWELTSRGHAHLSKPQSSQIISLKCVNLAHTSKNPGSVLRIRTSNNVSQRCCQLCSSLDDTFSCLQTHLVPLPFSDQNLDLHFPSLLWLICATNSVLRGIYNSRLQGRRERRTEWGRVCFSYENFSKYSFCASLKIKEREFATVVTVLSFTQRRKMPQVSHL